jgi:ATP-dependent Clp protease ATP-binding subunit ClpA
VTFQPLLPETVLAITHKELSAVAQREGLTQSGLRLRWTDRLLHYVAQAGFDARYSARPLQRTIETAVVTPLARSLLDRPDLHDVWIEVDLDAGGKAGFCVGRLLTPAGRRQIQGG